MLENIPRGLGEALSTVKAGIEKTVSHAEFAQVPDSLTVTSPAFTDGGAIPARFTADGEGVSPPLAWAGVPAHAAALVLIVEDPDAPAINPLVHLIAWNLLPNDGGLEEGELASPAGEGRQHDLGRNSFLKDAWLPPDPPTGHGTHRYLFQLFALERTAAVPASPGRAALVDAMKGHVIAKGLLTGTYQRA